MSNEFSDEIKDICKKIEKVELQLSDIEEVLGKVLWSEDDYNLFGSREYARVGRFL